MQRNLNGQKQCDPEAGQGHRRRYGSGVIWSILGTVSLQGSTFVVSIVLANILGKQQFGEYSMVQTTLLALAGIAQLGTGVTATKYVAEYRDTDNAKVGRLLGLCSQVTVLFGLFGVAILLLSARWLSIEYWHAPHLHPVMVVGSLFVLFAAINAYQLGALAGLAQYRALANASLAQALVYVCLCVLGGAMYGVPGAISALAITAFIRWAIYNYVLKRELASHGITVDRKHAWRERAVLWSFALPAAVTGFTAMPAIWYANAILARQPDGFSELGMYGAAVVIKNVILLLPQVFNNVGITYLNNRLGAQDAGNYWKIFRLNLLVSMLSILTGIVVLSYSGHWVLNLFGEGFSSGYHVLLILLLSSLFEAMAISIYQVIQSSGRMWFSLFAVALPRDTVFVSLAIFLVPRYGAEGLAAAYTLAWLLALVVIAILARSMGRNLAIQ